MPVYELLTPTRDLPAGCHLVMGPEAMSSMAEAMELPPEKAFEVVARGEAVAAYFRKLEQEEITE